MISFHQVMIMPRQARKQSTSNIYHVMLRGINRQTIFENNGDRSYFMTVLKNCKEVSGFRLHAFCLMDNHVHLLIEPAGEPLSLVIKRIGDRYVTWYNLKYQRTGHLFQNRYKSENVETDGYFMTVLRYILQNPMKAGMEKQPGAYRWSSYLAYEKGAGSITDIQFATELFGGREILLDFVRQHNEDDVMDDTNYEWRLRDDQAKEIMSRITRCDSTPAFQALPVSVRKEYIVEMYLEKLSMNQIARLTGLSPATVHKAVRSCDPDRLSERKKLVLRESDAFDFDFEQEIW